MSDRSRLLVAGLAGFALAGFAALVGGGSDRGAPRSGADVVEPPSRADLQRQVAAKIERAEKAEDVVQAKEEDPDGEPGPSQRDLAALSKLEAEAEPVARRFFGAFAAYELGEGSEERAVLRATASPALVDELLSTAPRVPPGAAAPETARLGKVEFVPGNVVRGRIVGAELVGELRRGGEAEPIAIELRLSAGEWLVLGLGR